MTIHITWDASGVRQAAVHRWLWYKMPLSWRRTHPDRWVKP